jgi:hypothetical protein
MKVSPEIQYHHILHHRELHYKSFQKKYEVPNLEKLLQTVKIMVFGNRKQMRQFTTRRQD